MKGLFVSVLLLLLASCASVAAPPQRPHIYGIGLVRLRVTNMEKAKQFYKDILGLREDDADFCFTPKAVCFFINFNQELELIPTVSPEDKGGLDLIGFWTADIEKTRRFLKSRGIETASILGSSRKYFVVLDPEGHQIAFESAGLSGSMVLSSLSHDLIHAGFVVHDRGAEDRFFREVLGFNVYWHGGMKDSIDDWVDMQVPDGTNWLEYMLNVSPKADKRELGVMNHIAMGVPDIHAAYKQLVANGWKPTEEPKIGRDGKWQLNLYDPDDTRIEFMEFTPTEKPCCSSYAGPHPGESSKTQVPPPQ